MSAAKCTGERVQGSGFRNWESGVGSRESGQPPMLRLGFRILTGLPKAAAEAITAARQAGPFRSVDDFARRTRLSQAIVASLAEADAFGSLEHRPPRGAVAGAGTGQPCAQHAALSSALRRRTVPGRAAADAAAGAGLCRLSHVGPVAQGAPAIVLSRRARQAARHARWRAVKRREWPARAGRRHRAAPAAAGHGPRHHVRHARR